MEIQGIELCNTDKLERALNGVMGNAGALIGGVGGGAYYEDGVWKRAGVELSEKEAKQLEDDLIVEYDRIGGLMKKDGEKLSTGGFYDFKAKAARKEPVLAFEYRVNGQLVVVPEGHEAPRAVKAQKLLAEQKEEEVKKGKKKV